MTSFTSHLLRRPALAMLGSAVFASAAALAGCTVDGRGEASLEDSIQPPSRMMALADRHEAAPRPPLAALPGAVGAVTAVKTRGYVDGLRQDIALGGGTHGIGQPVGNGITVLVRTSRQPTLDEAVPLDKPTEGAIRSEIGAQFPHLPMQVVERPSSNHYGSYGLALGRAQGRDGGAVRCAYMWQWIDANRLPRGADLVGPASVRVRLCRSDMTFDAMAAAMDALVIAPEGAAPDAPAVIVSAAVPPEATAAGAAPGRAARRRLRRVAQRHRPVPAVAAAPAASPDGDGPRYMSVMPAPAVLSADLPPQALLGPGKTN